MKIEQQLQRIAWRLGSGKAFTPNQNDIEAYNDIAEYIDMKQKQQVIDNQLFGKLYIFVYREFVRHYKATVMDEIPQKELNKILARDVNSLLLEVMEDLNMFELKNAIEAKRHKDYSPMTYDEVVDNLKVMVNGAINTYTK